MKNNILNRLSDYNARMYGGGKCMTYIYKERERQHEHFDSTSRPFGSTDLAVILWGVFDV